MKEEESSESEPEVLDLPANLADPINDIPKEDSPTEDDKDTPAPPDEDDVLT